VGRLRVAQKVFPSSLLTDGAGVGTANFVPADEFSRETMRIREGETRPLVELAVEFTLTPGQVENEGVLHNGRTLARLAAKTLAIAEDSLLFQGEHVARMSLGRTGRITNGASAGKGLVGLAEPTDPVNLPIQGVGMAIFGAVTRGIAVLTARGQPPPHALFLETSVYADAYAPLRESLATAADRMIPLLEGGFYGTGALPRGAGLLVSLAGEPTTVYIAQDAVTAFTREDADGDYRFRVFERLQYVVRDRESLQWLQLRPIDAGRRPAEAVEPELEAGLTTREGDGGRHAGRRGPDGGAS
jgi:uncharacterized linocin/CFP29 family protein